VCVCACVCERARACKYVYSMYVCTYVIVVLRQLFASLSSRRYSFNLMAVHVGFVLDNLEVGQALPSTHLSSERLITGSREPAVHTDIAPSQRKTINLHRVHTQIMYS
jgi:hypothetical protein